MSYRKITLEVVVKDDDAQMFTQALNDARSHRRNPNGFRSEIREEETGEPENAAEIVTKVS